jgi:hypothetical protein
MSTDTLRRELSRRSATPLERALPVRWAVPSAPPAPMAAPSSASSGLPRAPRPRFSSTYPASATEREWIEREPTDAH